MAFDLGGGAGQDVEAEVVVDEEMAEAVEHVEVPGEDGREEEREAEEEVEAEAAQECGLQRDDDQEREGEGDAGGSLGHEGEGETGEEEVPGAGWSVGARRGR